VSGFQIRPAIPADAPVIAEIHERGWQLAYGHFLSPETLAGKSAGKRIAFWQERIVDPARLVLVGTDEADAVLGFVYGGPVLEHEMTSGSIDDFDSELYILHCREEVQGQGLGRLLTAALARQFQLQGTRSLVLWAFADNEFRVFYDRLGGEIVAMGVDEGHADVAYGWRDIATLIAACEGGAKVEESGGEC
jgi:ribosomal protein S18 acetylase RimI-like enzyme